MRGVLSSVTRLALVTLFGFAILGSTAAPALATGPAPDKATAKFEVDFMTNMIDHHGMAIQMAQMCVQRATHQQLRAMCQNIIAAQSAEIDQMQAWLQSWYGVSHEPEMTNGEMQQIERLASLSSARFELTFMEMLIRHHRKAISEAGRCLERAYQPALRGMCQNIIATQSAELAQLETWLCAWYDRCGGRGASASGAAPKH